jgi:hypothetical protein
MDDLPMNSLLNRNQLSEKLTRYIDDFYTTDNKKARKGLYVFGKSGSGKSSFVKRTLTELNYDVVVYDGGDSRNKSIIETISSSHLSSYNILSVLNNKKKKLVLLMDEIDGMNNGDKGGITALIKLIRPKKTKKQHLELNTNIPIVCIGSCVFDKKLNELMKVCEIIELQMPLNSQISIIGKQLMPNINTNDRQFLAYVGGDLRKLHLLYTVYKKDSSSDLFINQLIKNSDLSSKRLIEVDIKTTLLYILNNDTCFDDHEMISDNDRTISGLLFHENALDYLEKVASKKEKSSIILNTYLEILVNLCFADYMDRLIFQKQIWQLNEMSSIIKTLYNTHLLHNSIATNHEHPKQLTTIRFTKILTKYSTEYNNLTFVNDISQSLGLDKCDVLSLFVYLKAKYSENQIELLNLLSMLEISHLDSLRLIRYIDKYTSQLPLTSEEINEEE